MRERLKCMNFLEFPPSFAFWEKNSIVCVGGVVLRDIIVLMKFSNSINIVIFVVCRGGYIESSKK